MKIIKTPILNDITDSEWEQMLELLCVRTNKYAKNTVIFRAGMTVCEIGIVNSGSVNIENIDPWGNKSILGNVSAGGVFAETYALCKEPMTVYAVAAENSEIVFLNIDRLLSAENSEYTWYLKLLKNILTVSSQKNLALSSRIFFTGSKTVRGRVSAYFSAIYTKTGRATFQIPFNRQQMADYLGVERSALSKELCKMRDDGLIDFYKNTFKIKKPL